MITKVIGVGGAGGEAVDLLANESLRDVELVLANTDTFTWTEIKVLTKIKLGLENTSTNRDRVVGEKMCEESRNEIEKVLTETDSVILTGGLGGGTGSAALPFFARMAKDKRIPVKLFVTKPFSFEYSEGRITTTVKNAEVSLAKLEAIEVPIYIIDLKAFRENVQTNRLTYNLTLDKYSRGITLLMANLIRVAIEDTDRDVLTRLCSADSIIKMAVRIFKQLQ